MKLTQIKIAISLQFLLAMALGASAAVTPAEQDKQIKDAEARMDSLSEYASSTVKGKDDVPVSLSGALYVRLKDHDYFKPNALLAADRARTWIDGDLDLALGVYPNSYVNLWTTLQMPYDFTGWNANNKAFEPNYVNNPFNTPERDPYHHHVDLYGPGIWEELTTGIDLRSSYVGMMFKAGGVLWTHASPLTVWEREAFPRFPDEFETFEEERTVSTYYKEKMFRPVKEGGRAFWTNRSFGGVMLDAYRLPWDMTGQILISQPHDADIGARDGLRVLAGQPGDAEMTGSLDFRGDVYLARLAKEKLGPGFTVGANYVQLDFDRGIINETEFLMRSTSNARMGDVPTIINSRVGSIDFKGNLNPKFFIMGDFAFAIDDSVKFARDTSTAQVYFSDPSTRYVSTIASPAPAAYGKVQDKHWIPLTGEFIYVPKQFFSPYAMTDYSRSRAWRKDEFYLGAGAYRYCPNLMGVNIKAEPEFNRGRIDFLYGVHRQVEAGRDVLVFDHRLNGRQEWESMTSWSKFSSALPIDSGAASYARYDSRVGALDSKLKLDIQDGGLRGGTWETWEVFTPYASSNQIKDTIMPFSRKWSTVISVEGAYDIGAIIGYEKNVMIHLNTAMSGISKADFAPLVVSSSQKDALLWSWFGQSEPSIAITPSFHMLGIFGWEIFRAAQAYRTKSVVFQGEAARVDYELAPINYLETAVGFGFDWDFTPRAGIHVRYRYATHTDETMPQNNYKANFVTAETKVWF